MKPRLSAMSSEIDVAGGDWKRLTEALAPNLQWSLPFYPFWGAQGSCGLVGSKYVTS